MRLLLVVLTLIATPAALSAQSPAASSPPAPDTARYTVLMMEKPAGVQTTTITAEGERQSFFEFNDRGRGPRLTSRVVTGADGLPLLVETTGNDYFKGPVGERFSLSGGEAAWKNKGEGGRRGGPGEA